MEANQPETETTPSILFKVDYALKGFFTGALILVILDIIDVDTTWLAVVAISYVWNEEIQHLSNCLINGISGVINWTVRSCRRA
jgi:hypothetical protein